MKLSTKNNSDLANWLTGVNPQQNTNWVNVCRLTYSGTTPSGSFDISKYNQIMIVCNMTASMTGSVSAYFDSDSGGNYSLQYLAGNSTTPYSGRSANTGFTLAANWGSISNTTTVIDKRSKTATATHSTNMNTTTAEVFSYVYTGSASMNTINLSSTSTFTGVIEIYGWQDVKITSLATYELVKEYNLSSQTLSDTISIDGDLCSEIRIVSSYTSIGGAYSVMARLNGDTGNNYYNQFSYGQGGTSGAYVSGATNSLTISYNPQAGYYSYGDSTISTKTGLKKGCLTRGISESILTAGTISSYWTGTGSVTSLSLFTSGTITGNIKVYRLVTQQLLKQNIKPIELVLNKTYSNSSVSEFIDVTDCDELEITFIGSTGANSINIYPNSDQSTAWKYAIIQNITSSTIGGSTGGTSSVPMPLIGPNGSNAYVKVQICIPNKSLMRQYSNSNSNAEYVEFLNALWQGSASFSTINLTCSGAFTGKIKVWKKY
jgi:hypothetical protein